MVWTVYELMHKLLKKSGTRPGLKIPRHLWRTGVQTEEQWLQSARQLYELMCRNFGLSDLAGKTVLDVGCGTKLSKLLINEQRPVGRYTGVDVKREVIDFLKHHVDDERFSYHHINVHNELYNPDGTPLKEYSCLPLNGEQFDIICLFSVFTHLSPEDYHQMLHVLRPHIRPGGRLIFSLFLQKDFLYTILQEARSGNPDKLQEFVNTLLKKVQALPSDRQSLFEAKLYEQMGIRLEQLDGFRDSVLTSNPETLVTIGRYLKELSGETLTGYIDRYPNNPLLHAAYSRDYAFELIKGTGWEVVSLNPPEPGIWHYFICRPDNHDEPEQIHFRRSVTARLVEWLRGQRRR